MSETTKVSVFACGGAGINALKRIIEVKDFTIPEDVELVTIDTSESNKMGLPNDIPFVKISAFGSGKDRSTNADLIYNQIEQIDISDSIGDINIILASLAGGSGSLIANMLSAKIANLEKVAINMVIVDMSSQKSCENSINALKSFDNMAKKYKHYYPVMIYSNAEKGRKAVNVNMEKDLEYMIDLFNSDIEELDHRDKIHFLQPNCIDPSLCGVYSIGIVKGKSSTKGKESDKKGSNHCDVNLARTIHSIMSVNEDGFVIDGINAMVDYVGIADKNYTVVNGVAIDADLIKSLRLKSEQFRNRQVNQTNLNDLSLDDTEENNGIIV
jgi:hypothetical protein